MSTLEISTPTGKAFDAANKHRAKCMAAFTKDHNQYVAEGSKDDSPIRFQMERSLTALCESQVGWEKARKGVEP
jgi:hypothetical protein